MRIANVTGVVYRQQIRHHDCIPPALQASRAWHDTVLVRVQADNGLVGWGESFGHFGVASTTLHALQQVVAPRCAGVDIADPDGFAAVVRPLHLLGASGPVMYALSGVDIALWDLRGKAAGLPVHALLGGARTDTLPAYASMIRYGSVPTVDAECREAISRRYAGIKLHEVDLAAIEAASALSGPAGLPLMVDVNCAWSLDEAVRAAQGMARLPIHWLEEPLYPPDDHDALAGLQQQTQIPLAAGENAPSLHDLHRMLARGVLDYVQPSVTKIGGITAMRQVYEWAAARGARVAPHSPYFGPGLLATVHLCAALAPETLVEHLFYDLQPGPFDAALPQDGRFAVPQAPGLGMDPDPELLQACSIPA